jgi:hypothetical protein
MYVTAVPNRNSPPAVLVRESYRVDGKVKNRTVANLTGLPEEAIEAVRMALKGKPTGALSDRFSILSSKPHGHVEALKAVIKRLKLDNIIDTKPSQQRALIVALVAARVLRPASKLATSRWCSDTTLPEVFGLQDVDTSAIYAAMDWLADKQEVIEKRLARRHLEDGSQVFYDLSSTWVEGTKCPLARFGYSRDGKLGKQQINFGLVTDKDGRPVSVTVYPGNQADPATLQEQVDKLRTQFGLQSVTLVGDRGMVTQAHVDAFSRDDGIRWITALKSSGLRKLKAEGSLQLELFDQRNLFELESPEYPGERLVACRNPHLAERRRFKREALLDETRVHLDKVFRAVATGRLYGKAKIGLRVGRILNRFKMGKHFNLEIEDDAFFYSVNRRRVEEEASLDGIYVIRTNAPADALSSQDAVRSYKRLTRVEKAFRSLKTASLDVRPIHHHRERRVRAHFLLCLLAYYVEWHLRQAWAPLLFGQEHDASQNRDPVAPASPPLEAVEKALTKKTVDGHTVHSFRTLLEHLGTQTRNLCQPKGLQTKHTFALVSEPNDLQRRAHALLKTVS